LKEWRTLALLPSELRGFLEKHKHDFEEVLRTWDYSGCLLHDGGHLTKKVTVAARKERTVVIARATADAVSLRTRVEVRVRDAACHKI
jgi:hypothetical protein